MLKRYYHVIPSIRFAIVFGPDIVSYVSSKPSIRESVQHAVTYFEQLLYTLIPHRYMNALSELHRIGVLSDAELEQYRDDAWSLLVPEGFELVRNADSRSSSRRYPTSSYPPWVDQPAMFNILPDALEAKIEELDEDILAIKSSCQDYYRACAFLATYE